MTQLFGGGGGRGDGGGLDLSGEVLESLRSVDLGFEVLFVDVEDEVLTDGGTVDGWEVPERVQR